MEAAAGPQGQNLARGWGPPKTTAATTDQVQAEKADSVGKGGRENEGVRGRKEQTAPKGLGTKGKRGL